MATNWKKRAAVLEDALKDEINKRHSETNELSARVRSAVAQYESVKYDNVCLIEANTKLKNEKLALHDHNERLQAERAAAEKRMQEQGASFKQIEQRYKRDIRVLRAWAKELFHALLDAMTSASENPWARVATKGPLRLYSWIRGGAADEMSDEAIAVVADELAKAEAAKKVG